MQHLVLYTVCSYDILMSLHVPAGTSILVASTSPLHIQHTFKHCGAYITIDPGHPKQISQLECKSKGHFSNDSLINQGRTASHQVQLYTAKSAL